MEIDSEEIFDALCKQIENDTQRYNNGNIECQKTELKTGPPVKCQTELERLKTGPLPNSMSDIGNPNTPDHTNLNIVPGITEGYFPVYKRGMRRPILQLVLSCDEEGSGISYFDEEKNRWVKLDTTHPIDQISSMLIGGHL